MHFAKRVQHLRVLQAARRALLITPNSSCDGLQIATRDILYDNSGRRNAPMLGLLLLLLLRSMRCIHTCESYSIMKVPRAPAYTIHRVVCALSTWVSVIAKLSILTQLQKKELSITPPQCRCALCVYAHICLRRQNERVCSIKFTFTFLNGFA